MSKFWKKYLLFLFFIFTIFGLAIWIFLPVLRSTPVIKNMPSPLPSFLTLSRNQEVSTLDMWSPLFPVSFAQTIDTDAPSLTANSALAYDLTTNQMIFEKNPDEQLPMASLTKIMTAVVALEHPKVDDKYIVTSPDLVGEDSMGLDAGEVLSLQDLLYGLILHSGNDAAETLASNFPGGRNAFIIAMNQKAASLGLTHTHFTNPTGLEGDGKQYTTVYDLLIETRFALLNFPSFDQVVKTFDYTIIATATHKEYDLENETNLISSYPGVEGVKDGYTPEAGLCLVTYLHYGGHKIIAIILGSDDRRGEMKEILDYSLNKLGVTPPQHG